MQRPHEPPAGDDFLNIHNKMKVVCKDLTVGSASSLAIVFPQADLTDLKAGDKLKFYKLLPGVLHVANVLLGTATVDSILSECHQLGHKMGSSPYNVTFVGTVVTSLSRAAVYRVTFIRTLLPAVMTTKYNLVNFERRSGSNFVVQRNQFHDSCGSPHSTVT